MDDNTRPCERCNAPTSFERNNETEPHEGQVCDICDRWICNDCEDTRLLPRFEPFDCLCIDCGKYIENFVLTRQVCWNSILLPEE